MTQLTRALGLAGLTTGAVLASAAGASAAGPAPAAEPAPASVVVPVIGDAAARAVDPVLDLQLDPWANTAVDPLNNAVGTQIADFPPLSTATVTDPLTRGASAGELPGQLAGGLLGGLPLTVTP